MYRAVPLSGRHLILYIPTVRAFVHCSAVFFCCGFSVNRDAHYFIRTETAVRKPQLSVRQRYIIIVRQYVYTCCGTTHLSSNSVLSNFAPGMRYTDDDWARNVLETNRRGPFGTIIILYIYYVQQYRSLWHCLRNNFTGCAQGRKIQQQCMCVCARAYDLDNTNCVLFSPLARTSTSTYSLLCIINETGLNRLNRN